MLVGFICGAAIACSIFVVVIGWCRVGGQGDLTDEQIIARGDQRLADIIQGDLR